LGEGGRGGSGAAMHQVQVLASVAGSGVAMVGSCRWQISSYERVREPSPTPSLEHVGGHHRQISSREG
jgi:hypothetical protein